MQSRDHIVQSCERFLWFIWVRAGKEFEISKGTSNLYHHHRYAILTLNALSMLRFPTHLLVRNLFSSAFFLFLRKESLSSDLFPFSFIVHVACSNKYSFLIDISDAKRVFFLIRRAKWFFDLWNAPNFDLIWWRKMMVFYKFYTVAIAFVELRSKKMWSVSKIRTIENSASFRGVIATEYN